MWPPPPPLQHTHTSTHRDTCTRHSHIHSHTHTQPPHIHAHIHTHTRTHCVLLLIYYALSSTETSITVFISSLQLSPRHSGGGGWCVPCTWAASAASAAAAAAAASAAAAVTAAAVTAAAAGWYLVFIDGKYWVPKADRSPPWKTCCFHYWHCRVMFIGSSLDVGVTQHLLFIARLLFFNSILTSILSIISKLLCRASFPILCIRPIHDSLTNLVMDLLLLFCQGCC